MKILLVDDEKNIRHTLRALLLSLGHEVAAVGGVNDALSALAAQSFDFMLTDFKLDDQTGIDLIRASKGVAGAPVSAVMTAFASFENAVKAIKEGAYDYIPKPFSNAQLEHLLKRVSALVELKRENERLRATAPCVDYFAGQTSPAMVRLEEFARKVSPSEEPVLVSGESGTGKTVFSRLIHDRSRRASHEFNTLDCGTMGEEGVDADLPRKLAAADSGTLVIEEVGNLSARSQAALSRFFGGRLALHCRVIATSSRGLDEAVKEGRFREDLFYRLNPLECALVPLRHRREDIMVLALGIFRQPFPDSVQKALVSHAWPGNIRELKNVVERIALLSRGRGPLLSDLPDSITEAPKRREGFSSGEPLLSLEELERAQIEKILRIEPNQEKAAQILGITTVTLWRKRRQFGLP